jgi:predicted nucleotidyltransferase
MNQIISDNIEKISALCASRKIRSLAAFGSVCTERFSQASDIDLLISFQPMPILSSSRLSTGQR